MMANDAKAKFNAATQHAVQLQYIMTREAKHAKKQQILRLLLSGLRGW